MAAVESFVDRKYDSFNKVEARGFCVESVMRLACDFLLALILGPPFEIVFEGAVQNL